MWKTKPAAQSTSDFSSKYQTSETSLKTSEVATLFVSATQKQELQTSRISSKAMNHPFNKTLLVFADFFTVNAHHTSIGQVDRYVGTTIGQLAKVKVPCRLTKPEHMNHENSPQKL